MAVPKEIIKIFDTLWKLPKSTRKGMLVPARVYATRKLLENVE